MLRTYKELTVWQKAFDLCVRAYRVSKGFPQDERYGPTAQLRRALVSVPSNIAEGYSRGSRRDYVRFLWIARGSLAEAETQLMLCKELGCAREAELNTLLEAAAEVERMLTALIRALKKKPTEASPTGNDPIQV